MSRPSALAVAAHAAIWAWAAAPAGTGDVAAQAHRNPAAPDSARHIQSMEPRSGPPGTVISIYTENLPFQGRVVLGMGAVGSGFEALGEAQQQEWGEVDGTLTVPEYATWDRALLVIIFNGNFVPTGLSDPFHVTNQDGLIHRTAWITDEGDDCTAIRDNDGFFYTLSLSESSAIALSDGSPLDRELQVGDELVVEGEFVGDDGGCSQGETVLVSQLRVVPGVASRQWRAKAVNEWRAEAANEWRAEAANEWRRRR